MSSKQIRDRDIDWVRDSNVLIAEVTTVSMGVGYEIGREVEMGKNILALHRTVDGKKLSAMIAGSDGITNKNYTDLEEAKTIIDSYFKTL